MATVRPLRQPAQRTLADAISTYLTVGLAGREHDGTRRVYAGVLRRLAARFGDDSPAAALDADEVAEWFIGEWGERRPATWNVSLDVIRAAGLYWREQGWTSPDPAADPAARLRRRKTAPDRDRALSRAQVERLLTDEKHPAARANALAHAVRERGEVGRGAAAGRRGPGPAQPAGPGPSQGRRHRRHRLADRNRAAAAPPAAGTQERALVCHRAGRPASSFPRPTWTSAAGPGSATSVPSNYSKRQRTERRSTSCATRHCPTTPRPARRPQCSWPGAVTRRSGRSRSTRGCRPRLWPGTRPTATPRGAVNR